MLDGTGQLRTRKLEEIAQNIGLSQLEDEVNKKSKRKKIVEGSNDGDLPDVPREATPAVLNPKTNANSSMQHTGVDVRDTDDTFENKFVGASSVFVDGEVLNGQVETSDGGTAITSDESDDDENDEHIILPATQGHVDPAVLASLPPSMQLNLLVQMREQQVAENRQIFQKVAKDPANFSHLQIQAYLKTVAFRRDINEVQKAAAGKGIGGIPSARIASEVDREYIFTTSYQGGQHKDSQNGADQPDRSTAASPKRFGETIRIEIEQQDIVGNMAPTGKLTSDAIEQSASRLGDQSAQQVTITTEVDEACGSEDCEIDWEDGIPAENGKDMEIEWEDGPTAATSHHDGGDVGWEDGNDVFISKGLDMCVGGDEVMGSTMIQIEEAELEEAIRRSLADFGPVGASKLVIREGLDQRNDVPAVGLDTIFSLDSCGRVQAGERERKGKAIVDEYQTGSYSKPQKTQAGVEGRGPFNGTPWGSSALGSPDTLGQKVLDEPKAIILDIDTPPASEQITNVMGSELLSRRSADDWVANKPLVDEHHNHTRSLDTHQEKGKEQGVSILHEEFSSVSQPVTSTRAASFSQMASSSEKGSASFEVKTIEEDSKSRAYNEQTSSCSYHGEVELIVEEQLPEKGMEEASASFKESKEGDRMVQDASVNKIPESDMLAGGSISKDFEFLDDDGFQDALLKEAEELDSYNERDALAKREMDLSREREELQAEIEAEHEAMQVDLQDERDLLLQEEMELRTAQRKNERDAESVTGEMFSDCQELLQMFGLPYIIAPMEAEAQCAFMDSVGLVDGVVTDDCDVFLFGGQNVFKNIFDDRKYVETYYLKDVETELGLNQEKLIHMALLLGSDYTEGISGIGIVNAIEVVNAFHGEIGLQKFKDWIDSPDLTLLEKLHPVGPKKQARKKHEEAVTSDDTESKVASSIGEGTAGVEKAANGKLNSAGYTHQQQTFMDKHRAVSKNWNVPDSFPSPLVISAYISPQVDKSTESFAWGRPDLEALRRLCFERFGWSKSKADELLLPVLKEHDRHETQLRLEAFYTFNQRFAKIRSKRIQKAVTRITGRRSSDLMDFPLNTTESPLSEPTNAANSPNEGNAGNGSKRKQAKVASQVKVKSSDISKEGRGRGRGRQTSRGRARAGSRKSGLKGLAKISSSETSSSEEADLKTHPANLEQTRRSTRLLKKEVPHMGEDQSCSSSHGGSSETENLLNEWSRQVEDLGSSVPKIAADSLHEIKDAEEGNLLAPDTHTSELRDEAEDESYLMSGGGFCNLDEQEQETKYGGSFCTRSEHGQDTMDGGGFCMFDEQGQETMDEGGFCNIDDQGQKTVVGSPEACRESRKESSLLVKGITGSGSLNTGALNVPIDGMDDTGLRAVPSLRRKKHRRS